MNREEAETPGRFSTYIQEQLDELEGRDENSAENEIGHFVKIGNGAVCTVSTLGPAMPIL